MFLSESDLFQVAAHRNKHLQPSVLILVALTYSEEVSVLLADLNSGSPFWKQGEVKKNQTLNLPSVSGYGMYKLYITGKLR